MPTNDQPADKPPTPSGPSVPTGTVTSVAHQIEESVSRPALEAPKVSLDDYLAYQIAEKAKKQVLAFFALATLVVSVLLALYGQQQMKKLLEDQYTEVVKRKEREASARVDSLAKSFKERIESLEAEANATTEEHSQFLLASRLQLVSAATSLGADGPIDLSFLMGPIRNQEDEGATVGFGLVYALEAELVKQSGRRILLSARSVYEGAKDYDDFPGRNYQGSSLNGGVKMLQFVGASIEADWPYDTMTSVNPNGIKYRISSYRQIPVTDTTGLIAALRSRKLVPVALRVTDDMSKVEADGKLIIRPKAKHIGGHCVTLVGYNPSTAEFKFANMWGTSWGAAGFGYIRATVELTRFRGLELTRFRGHLNMRVNHDAKDTKAVPR